MPCDPDALAAIDALTRTFFGAFTNKGRAPDVDVLHRLFVPEAVIAKGSAHGLETFTLTQFIEPRRALLTGGRLADFEERELWSRTDVFGSIAQRFCVYEKEGILDGKPFAERGAKVLQIVRLPQGWKISALSWEDESAELEVPEREDAASARRVG